jgi:hypothetical protein
MIDDVSRLRTKSFMMRNSALALSASAVAQRALDQLFNGRRQFDLISAAKMPVSAVSVTCCGDSPPCATLQHIVVFDVDR